MKKNDVARFMVDIAKFTWVGGFILGVLVGNMYMTEYFEFRFEFSDGIFSWSDAIYVWSGSFVVGVLFYGFGEALELLQGIKDKIGGASNNYIENKDTSLVSDLPSEKPAKKVRKQENIMVGDEKYKTKM